MLVPKALNARNIGSINLSVLLEPVLLVRVIPNASCSLLLNRFVKSAVGVVMAALRIQNVRKLIQQSHFVLQGHVSLVPQAKIAKLNMQIFQSVVQQEPA